MAQRFRFARVSDFVMRWPMSGVDSVRESAYARPSLVLVSEWSGWIVRRAFLSGLLPFQACISQQAG